MTSFENRVRNASSSLRLQQIEKRKLEVISLVDRDEKSISPATLD
jgi:hypothetical protein